MRCVPDDGQREEQERDGHEGGNGLLVEDPDLIARNQ